MELLAPAGGIEQLRAAITFGADAIYLATDRFGMRARACNFPLDTLKSAVDEAHAAGVKVHVTCNILMSQDDLSELPDFFRAVQASGADALIISDLGAFSLAKKYAPDVERHVSTQASVANAEAARAWYEMGAQRIVCAREMSLAQIAAMRKELPSDLQIEVFAHGAMCMAVSGRCLISSYLTGRSANRGHCTQPCRWAYRIEEEKRPGEYFDVEEDGGFSFLMNAKDLNMLAHLDELRAAGVDSIKIEGRNKKAFYVASVVSAYRRVLDGEPATTVEHELYDLSHRPYNTGFFFGEAEQASEYDGYEQECLHVADVIGCVPTNEGTGRRVIVRCRNRWAEGDAIEALVPRSPVVNLTVRGLCWHPEPVDAEGGPVRTDPFDAYRAESVPVPVANRSVALYSFEVGEDVPAGSYLRIRQFRRSARHE